jgi:replication initiation and membrane attachment protein DnaB
LCNQLISDYKIDKRCIGHNVKIDGISEFEGIVTRSNFNSNFTDLNPSFNFETFRKFLENEQFA